MNAEKYWSSKDEAFRNSHDIGSIIDAYNAGLKEATEQNNELCKLLFEIDDYYIPAKHPDGELVAEALQKWEYTKQ